MYALQTVGSTTSSVKDDTEVLELDDNGNSIVEQIITNSNNIKRTGNLTGNSYQSSQLHPVIDNNYEPENVRNNDSVGLCFWTLFQTVGLTSVATIICHSIIYNHGYFDTSSQAESTSISGAQYSNWHYTLTTVGFIYLYANSIFLVSHNKSNVTLPYIMLHTFAYLVSALGLFAMYTHKNMYKPVGSKFYVGHLYSIHAWTGVFAAALFTFQWLTAIVTFVMPCLHNLGLPLGKMFSLYTVLVSSISLITGVNVYAVKNLKEEYVKYSPHSLVLNGFGILIMIFLFLIAFMVIKPNKK